MILAVILELVKQLYWSEFSSRIRVSLAVVLELVKKGY